MKIGIDIDGVILDYERILKIYGDLYDLKLSKQTPLIPGAKDVIDMLQKDGNKLIVISARGGMIEEMKDVAIEKFKEEMKKLEQNEYLKEVSNWGEIYRYIKEMESK